MKLAEQFTLSIRDINYGQHMDHLALLGYLHETRIRYLKKLGYAENNVDGLGSSLVVINLECAYKHECFMVIRLLLKLIRKSVQN